MLMVIWDEEFMACWGDHGYQCDELLEIDLQISVLIEVCKELIQSLILLDVLSAERLQTNTSYGQYVEE